MGEREKMSGFVRCVCRVRLRARKLPDVKPAMSAWKDVWQEPETVEDHSINAMDYRKSLDDSP
jgi:hypothetical protein